MDDPVQLKEELAQDGSTGYVPSVTMISVTEDSDDLHLGAEAVSFDCENSNQARLLHLQIPNAVISENCGSRRRKFTSRGLVVMKEIHSSFESTDTSRTYSSISSVVDLLQARECDADDMLAGLGFDFASDTTDKRDILSRFEPSLLPYDEHIKAGGRFFHENGEVLHNQPEYHHSISKAKEWLDMHHTEENHAEKSNKSLPNKHQTTTTDQPAPASTKRPSLLRSKLLRRFSKSRPSSFELLLPKLKEEDSNLEGGHLVRSKSCDSAIEPCSPIRGSSLERVIAVEKSPAENPISKNGDVKQQVMQAPHQGSFAEPVSCPLDLDKKMKNKLQIDESNFLDPFTSSPLITNQVESFELEEINRFFGPTTSFKENYVRFNNDSGSSESRIVPRNADLSKCNYGDSLERLIVATPESHKSQQLRPVDASLAGGQASEHGSDENESSSGFEEEDTSNMASVLNGEATCEKAKPTVQSYQMKRSSGSTITLPKSTTDIESQRKTSDSFLHSNNIDNTSRNFNMEAFLQVRSVTLNRFSTNYIPLRRVSQSQSACKISHKCIVTPVPAISDEHTSNCIEPGKCRRRFLQVRRRRKEFANRCAVSGDTIRDLCTSSSLMRHNGRFAVRKRRPGQFHYVGSASETGESQGKTPSRQLSFDGSNDDSAKRTTDKRLFRSVSMNAMPSISEVYSDHQTPNKTDTSTVPDKYSSNPAQSTTFHRTNNQDGGISCPKLASNRCDSSGTSRSPSRSELPR